MKLHDLLRFSSLLTQYQQSYCFLHKKSLREYLVAEAMCLGHALQACYTHALINEVRIVDEYDVLICIVDQAEPDTDLQKALTSGHILV